MPIKIPFQINPRHQGKFLKVSEFDVFETDVRRKYKGKVFLFDKCIIYTETLGKNKLSYRGYFRHETLGFTFEDGKNNFVLYAGKKGHQEIEFTADPNTIQLWIQALSAVLMSTVVMIEKKKIEDNRHRMTSRSDLGPLHVLLRLNSPSMSLTDASASTSVPSGLKRVSSGQFLTPSAFDTASLTNSSRTNSRPTTDPNRYSVNSVGNRSLTSKKIQIATFVRF